MGAYTYNRKAHVPIVRINLEEVRRVLANPEAFKDRPEIVRALAQRVIDLEQEVMTLKAALD